MNLKAKNLKSVIETALATTTLPLNHQGTSSMVQIGHVGMTKTQIVDNLMKVIQTLGERFPGGYKNIRSLHIKTETSMAIPMHVSTSKFSHMFGLHNSRNKIDVKGFLVVRNESFSC